MQEVVEVLFSVGICRRKAGHTQILRMTMRQDDRFFVHACLLHVDQKCTVEDELIRLLYEKSFLWHRLVAPHEKTVCGGRDNLMCKQKRNLLLVVTQKVSAERREHRFGDDNLGEVRHAACACPTNH
jgi:hypothetical protein